MRTQASLYRSLGRVLLPLLLGVIAIIVVRQTPAEAVATSMVRVWNLHASNALANAVAATPSGAGQTPPVATLHMAMVQATVYDAVNAIDGGYQPYLAGLPVASRLDSKEAAVATAAHHLLVGLTPPLPQAVRDWLDVEYAASLATIPDGAAKDGGIAIGDAAATAMLAVRADDGRYSAFSFTVGTEPGQWRPTSGVNDPFAWVAKVRPFMMATADQFRSDGPLALTSAEYAEEFNEVKALGSATSAVRTPEQTALARFYTDHAIAMWNRAFRGISEAEDLTLVDEARLFAVLNVAAADSIIGCWDDKAYWSFWRPITAIRLADTDNNPATVADPAWTPLINTPPYPDHVSGFNCLTGGLMHAAQDFFGTDKMTFSVRSNPVNVTRNYDRFSDTFKDTTVARMYAGIHFRIADVQGVVLGRKVAHLLKKNFFQPIGKK